MTTPTTLAAATVGGDLAGLRHNLARASHLLAVVAADVDAPEIYVGADYLYVVVKGGDLGARISAVDRVADYLGCGHHVTSVTDWYLRTDLARTQVKTEVTGPCGACGGAGTRPL